MRYFVILLMFIASTANANCWAPSPPIGNDSFMWQTYNQQQAEFNRCIAEQQRRQQQQYEQQQWAQQQQQWDQRRQQRNQQLYGNSGLQFPTIQY